MGSIDKYDQAMSTYSFFQSITNGWGRRVVQDILDVMWNNTFCVWKKFKKVNTQNIAFSNIKFSQN